MAPSWTQVLDGRLTNTDWSKTTFGDERLRHIEQIGMTVLIPIDDGDGVGVAPLFQHRQVDGSLAVDADDIRLNLRAILGMCRRLATITVLLSRRS